MRLLLIYFTRKLDYGHQDACFLSIFFNARILMNGYFPLWGKMIRFHVCSFFTRMLCVTARLQMLYTVLDAVGFNLLHLETGTKWTRGWNQLFVYFFGGPVRHIGRPEVENHLARCLTGMSHSTECPQSLIVGRNIVQLSTELLHL